MPEMYHKIFVEISRAYICCLIRKLLKTFGQC